MSEVLLAKRQDRYPTQPERGQTVNIRKDDEWPPAVSGSTRRLSSRTRASLERARRELAGVDPEDLQTVAPIGERIDSALLDRERFPSDDTPFTNTLDGFLARNPGSVPEDEGVSKLEGEMLRQHDAMGATRRRLDKADVPSGDRARIEEIHKRAMRALGDEYLHRHSVGYRRTVAKREGIAA
jgi:hypothetical protein